MKIIHLPTGYDDDKDMILAGEVSEYLPRKIFYKHNEKHIYILVRDKNGS